MKKIFTLAAAVLASFSLWAADPTSTLDVAEAAGTNEYVSANLDANTPKSLTYCGYNSSGSGSYTGFLEGTSRWKLSSSRTISFKVQNCDSVALQCQFTKDATTSVKYAIGSDEAVEFITNGSDKKVERTGGFKTETAGEITFTISVNNDLLLGYIYFFPASSTPSTDPVEAAEISGVNACTIGASVELTCTAAKATAYQWYLGGEAIDGATAKKYTFTPSAAGSYSFTCSATNDYTSTPVMADAFVVAVTDPAEACGELIKATHTGGKTATVTGVLGGTADKNTANDGKFGGKGQWFGFTLAAGSFQVGDELNVHTTTAAGQGTIAIYADKNGNTLLYDTESMGVAGDNIFMLPAALNNATTLYICRTEANTWNGYVDYISVSRSCEASSDANIAKVWVMAGEEEMVFEAEEDGVTYNLVVPATVDMTQLSINYTLAHPKASADVASPFTLDVPAAGDAANSQVVVVTAQDGSQKTYTFNVTKSAAASTDASLKSLAVTGYTLDPTFAADVYAYTITKAYGADDPTPQMVVCEPNDATAHPQVAAGENALVVTVTAEDGQTQLVYTINIAVAEAPKKINEVIMSNDYSAYILATEPNNIYAYYLAGQEAPTVKSYNVNEGTTWAQEGNTITLTGADQSTAEYTLIVEAVTPLEFTADEIIFDGSESWIKSGYGFDAEKKWRFSKTDSDYSREIAGKTHIEMFLPACDSIALLEANVSTRDIKVYINGAQLGDKVSLKKNEKLGLKVSQSAPFILTIASAQTSGDGGVASIQLFKNATALENIEAAGKAVKVIVNGQLMIKKGNVLYNATGAVVR